jgi:type VII secretion protein EccB
MARQPSTWLQVSAQRFETRRMQHALVRGDAGMHDDPLRAQSASLAAGGIVAAVIVAVCVVLAFIKPHGTLGSAQIVLTRETGALYVRLGDTWHPTPNLSSARLAAGAAVDPAIVTQQALAGVKRGPAVGIPGAPAVIGRTVPLRTWTVCDGPDTVVIAGDEASAIQRFDPTRSLLVTPRGESAAITYLLYDGRRAEVDLRNPAVVAALRLDDVVPLPVSRALLDTVPEVAPIAAPHIEDLGASGPSTMAGARVGAVVRVSRAEITEAAEAVDYYVVLADGIQRISEMAADLIRFAYPGGPAVVLTVAPAAIAATRVVHGLPLATLPDRAGTPIGSGSSMMVCARWQADATAAKTNTAVSVGRSSAVDGGLVLAQADGDGPDIDRIVIAAGHSADVRSARIVGDDGHTGPRFVVTDTGVVHGVRDDAAATALGLSEDSGGAPWSILARLPRGPELSVDGAARVHDVLAAPP